MKSNTSKKSTVSGTSVPNMQIADALAYFDFATGYPQWIVDEASITYPYLHEIGMTLMDGIGQAVMGNDIELLKKCGMALRERLCFNIEEMRVPFQMGGPKVISMMSPFQLAVLFARLPLCEYLFNFALTMPGTALRAGIDAPVPMICQLVRNLPQAKPAEQVQIQSMLQDFSDQLAASLASDRIVTIHHIGEDRGCPFLVMELLQGETLDARMNRDGRMTLTDSLSPAGCSSMSSVSSWPVKVVR